MLGFYDYSFGEHLWTLKISYGEDKSFSKIGSSNFNKANIVGSTDLSGILVVGILNK